MIVLYTGDTHRYVCYVCIVLFIAVVATKGLTVPVFVIYVTTLSRSIGNLVILVAGGSMGGIDPKS